MAVVPNESDPVLDRVALLDRIGGDAEFLQELAQMFPEQRQRLLQEVRAAVCVQDSGALARAAHTLKGCVASLGAGPAFQAALRLEMLARGGQIREAEGAAAELESEVLRFEQALLRLAEELRTA